MYGSSSSSSISQLNQVPMHSPTTSKALSTVVTDLEASGQLFDCPKPSASEVNPSTKKKKHKKKSKLKKSKTSRTCSPPPPTTPKHMKTLNGEIEGLASTPKRTVTTARRHASMELLSTPSLEGPVKYLIPGINGQARCLCEGMSQSSPLLSLDRDEEEAMRSSLAPSSTGVDRLALPSPRLKKKTENRIEAELLMQSQSEILSALDEAHMILSSLDFDTEAERSARSDENAPQAVRPQVSSPRRMRKPRRASAQDTLDEIPSAPSSLATMSNERIQTTALHNIMAKETSTNMVSKDEAKLPPSPKNKWSDEFVVIESLLMDIEERRNRLNSSSHSGCSKD